MLQQRIITAVVLLAFLLPAVFYPDPTAFMGLAVVLIAAGAWEWAKLNQCRPLTAYGIAVVSAAGCLAAWYFGFALLPYRGLWLMAGAVWVLGGAWLLRGGVGVWARVPQPVPLPHRWRSAPQAESRRTRWPTGSQGPEGGGTWAYLR